MDNFETIQKMIAIARYYYQYNLSRTKIADILGISRQLVSKLLEQAINEGYVCVRVIDPFETNNQLRDRLCKLTDLKDAIIVPDPNKGNDGIKKNIGYLGSMYIIDKIQQGNIIGLGWGSTLLKLVKEFERREIPRVKIIPMIGGLGQVDPELQVNSLATVLGDKINAKPFLLFSLASYDNKDSRDQILRSSEDVIKYWDDLDIALVGIGQVAVEEYFFNTKQVPRSIEERKFMRQKGAVGDINTHYYDINGNEIFSDKLFKVSATLDQLRKTPLVVAFAGGMHKVTAIQGAIEGKLIDVLITDENVAQELIKIYSKKQSH